ncbi:carboxymuconolactone decarboxylase family protein [Ensifer sp. 4252]|uniref:carboxymuconolactone decarboxylase family protein n=1 Tax=Ensifer sp. 4252 TaxID=3373915 RepID=UPI003D24AD18
MTQRFNYFQLSPNLVKAVMALGNEIKKGSIEETILILVHMRASQMIGSAFRIDMHAKEAIIQGETMFSPHECAALLGLIMAINTWHSMSVAARTIQVPPPSRSGWTRLVSR